MASVHFLCRKCEARVGCEAPADLALCERCSTEHSVNAPRADSLISSCAACGWPELYVQKDFNRATGVALVAIGAVFVPWTWGLSLLAVTILDFGLYYILGDVTVCYDCRAVHRGYPNNPEHKPFDLAVHDRHVYGAAPPGAEEH